LDRHADLLRFYEILAALETAVGGKRRLSECDGRMGWPRRGVYFFFEPGESRSGAGEALRVVRVGTHALKECSKTTLWGRLRQHRGTRHTNGGNHRGSIFRKLVGLAIRGRDRLQSPTTWGIGGDAGEEAARLGLTRGEVRQLEHPLEVAVSEYIRAMPFLWVGIDDAPGPESDRGLLERHSIALLSNYEREPVDLPSSEWLGSYCDRELVRGSGLWNNDHVDKVHEPWFLSILERYVRGSGAIIELRTIRWTRDG
jgi:hypothetical protein